MRASVGSIQSANPALAPRPFPRGPEQSPQIRSTNSPLEYGPGNTLRYAVLPNTDQKGNCHMPQIPPTYAWLLATCAAQADLLPPSTAKAPVPRVFPDTPVQILSAPLKRHNERECLAKMFVSNDNTDEAPLATREQELGHIRPRFAENDNNPEALPRACPASIGQMQRPKRRDCNEHQHQDNRIDGLRFLEQWTEDPL